jgi:hypothetical protein
MDNLVQADVLGIFGRERLDLATLWPETTDDHYADAFRIYRNYDGSHSRFGDTYVSSDSADQSALAVYGAERSRDGALTLVVINKTFTDLTSTLALRGFAPGSAAQVWRWAGVGGGITRVSDQSLSESGFSATFPNRSISVVVIPPAVSGIGPQTQPTSQTPAGALAPGAQPGPVVASGPPPKCIVPRLAGLTLTKARARLRGTNCLLGKVSKKKSRSRRGAVVAQRPGARRQVTAGTRIALVLSRGR